VGETILTALFEKEKSSDVDKDIIFYDNDTYSFSQFNDLSSRLATGIKMLGIEKGATIGLLMPNMPEFIISYYGILKAGCAVVPINILSNTEDLQYIFNKSEIKCLIYWSNFERKVNECFKTLERKPKTICTAKPQVLKSDIFHEIIEGNWPASFDPFISYNDPAIIQFTSGTSGNPKGAILSHKNLFEAAQIITEVIKLIPEDKVLASLPLFHPFAQSVILNPSIIAGSEIHLHQRFDFDKILETLTNDKITIFVGVPSMVELFLNLPKDKRNCLESAKCLISSSGKLKTKVLNEFEQMYKKPILEGYGTSETLFVTSLNRLYGIRKPGSVGFQLEKIDIKVLNKVGEEVFPDEVGEITVKGVTVTEGYFNSLDDTKRNIKEGWLYTGDMGKIDMDGFLYIIDRKEDIINKGEFIVYPKEVEEVLYDNEKVKEVAVIGIPDKELRQEVKAFVILNENEIFDSQELINFCKERLPNYKAPKYIEFLDQLPKNYSGKILKRLLKKNNR